MKKLIIDQVYKRRQLIKFLFAGGLATLVNFSVLYFLVDICYLWYLLSSGLAFLFSFFVSFFLQKFWTFRDNQRDVIYRQMSMYLFVAIFGLSSNLFFMYILVDVFYWWYMFAQFVISACLAICNYYIYNFFIFNQKDRGISSESSLLNK